MDVLRLLGSALDTVDELILLYEGPRVVHENAVLARLLAGEPGAAGIRSRISGLVQNRLLYQPSTCDAVGTPPLPAGSIEIRAAPYRVLVHRLHPGSRSADSYTLVRLQREAACVSELEALLQGSRLTRQEIRVALLLAQRRSNEEIAKELGVSPHTARHHTDGVLHKLGFHSRRQVAALLRPQDPITLHSSPLPELDSDLIAAAVGEVEPHVASSEP